MSGIGEKLQALWNTGPGATSSPRSEKKSPKESEMFNLIPKGSVSEDGTASKTSNWKLVNLRN